MQDRVVPLSVPSLTGNERKYVNECLETNFVSSVGPFVERFEREFASYVGARFAVACASGTAALHLALRCLGIGPGDEVMVPDFTFIASANPIVYQGARPIFVDSELQSWNLDPGLVIEEIRRRKAAGKRLPRAVMVVHVLGHPADMEAIIDCCQEHGIAVVEDATEALGATYRGGRFAGRHVGTIGRLGCFSFNGNKIITTGGGGMLVTEDESLARRARHLSTQAKLAGLEYDHDQVGYNYRLTNIAAAIGVAQLEQLPRFLEAKRAIAAKYRQSLESLPGVTAAPQCAWAFPSMWLYSVLIDPDSFGMTSRDVCVHLQGEGLQCRPLWRPLSSMAQYRRARRIGGAAARFLFQRGLSLPCSVSLSEQQQQRVIAAIQRLSEGKA
jgi:aminotransferase in exopolysaccharide biosynthesis